MATSGVVIPQDEHYVHERVVAQLSFAGHSYPIERDDAWRIAWFLIGQCVEHDQAKREREAAA